MLFDRDSTNHSLLLYVKFTPDGNEDTARSAVIEAVEAAIRPTAP